MTTEQQPTSPDGQITADQTQTANQAGGGRHNALREFLGKLLAFQCKITGADAGAVYLRAGSARPAGIFVAYHNEVGISFDESTSRKIASIGERASEATSGGMVEPITLAGAQDLYAAQTTHNALAAPLLAEGKSEGACVVLVPISDKEPQSIKLDRLALTGARFEAFLWQQSYMTEAEHKVMLRETLELLDQAQRGTTASAMGSLLCDEMRRRFGCTRVSIGMIRGDHIRVMSVSGSDDLDKHAPTVEALEAAMEETALQDAEVLYPPSIEMEQEPGSRRVIHEHARLSEAFGPSSVVSLPLRIEDDLVGVMVLERDASDPFPDAVLPLLRLVAEFVGPAVYTRRLADRRTPEVLRDDMLDLGAGIVGPRHTAKKLLALVAVVIFILLAIIPIPAKVAGTMEIRPEVGRAVVPPFAGFLKSFEVRPGDSVGAGQLVATLDTQELMMSLTERNEHLSTLTTQRDDALAQGLRSEARKFGAQIEESIASINLLNERITLAELRSPIAGTISRGDLEKLVGAPVDASKALFEIVGPEVRVVIEIDERFAGRVEIDQHGSVSSRARPGQKLAITVTRVNPVAQAREGANVFLIEATFDEPPEWLRPGMTGTAKLNDGWSTPLWELSRPLVDAFRMWSWL
jgi:multidrug efflux pump subunit AcrA (membrane-fusion protein)